MEYWKPLYLSLLLLISPAKSDNILETIATTGPPTGLNTASSSSSLSCAQSLMSCQAYLHHPENNPPDLCCGPLRTMLANDHKCMCDFYTDGQVLQSMDVPKENAVKLAHACGSNPDISGCNGTSSSSNPASSSPYARMQNAARMKGELGLGGIVIINVIATLVFSSIQWF